MGFEVISICVWGPGKGCIQRGREPAYRLGLERRCGRDHVDLPQRLRDHGGVSRDRRDDSSAPGLEPKLLVAEPRQFRHVGVRRFVTQRTDGEHFPSRWLRWQRRWLYTVQKINCGEVSLSLAGEVTASSNPWQIRLIWDQERKAIC